MGLPVAICATLICFIAAVLLGWTLKETCDELRELRHWLITNGHAKYDVDLDGCTEFKLLEKKPVESTQPIDMPGPKEIGGT